MSKLLRAYSLSLVVAGLFLLGTALAPLASVADEGNGEEEETTTLTEGSSEPGGPGVEEPGDSDNQTDPGTLDENSTLEEGGENSSEGDENGESIEEQSDEGTEESNEEALEQGSEEGSQEAGQEEEVGEGSNEEGTYEQSEDQNGDQNSEEVSDESGEEEVEQAQDEPGDENASEDKDDGQVLAASETKDEGKDDQGKVLALPNTGLVTTFSDLLKPTLPRALVGLVLIIAGTTIKGIVRKVEEARESYRKVYLKA